MSKQRPTFAEEVRAAVRQSGMSQYRICKETGINKGYLSRFMLGKVGLGFASICKLAAALDLHIRAGPKGKSGKGKL